MPNPLTGQPWPWEPQPQAAPQPAADDQNLQRITQSLKDANGGLMGDPSTVTVMGTGAQANTPLDTGYKLYTFGNGASIEINAAGDTRNWKPASSAGKTASDVAAQAGILFGPGGQVYVKNTDTSPGAPPYVQSTDTQNNQQLANAKTVADTQYQQAQADKLRIDNQLASDPTNQALQQQKTQSDVAYQTAQTQKAKIDAAVAQGQLQVSQQNAATSAQNAASTAARVGSQNQLDIAQAGAAGQNAATAAQNAATTASRAPSQNQLDIAQAAAQSATAQSTLAKAAEPTVMQTGAAPTYTYWDPTQQQMVTAQNPAYLPTDPGRMTVQLQQQAQAQQQALNQQVQQGKLSPDQASAQFDSWWNQNIEPVKGDIATAQAKAQAAVDLQNAQIQNYQNTADYNRASLAETASNNAQARALQMLPYMVNPSALTTPGVTAGPRGFPQINPQQIMQNATFSMPNLQEIGRQGAAAALAQYSPTAQAHLSTPGPAGQPPAPGMPNVNSLLNMNSYSFGAPAAAAAAAAAGVGAAPGANAGPTPQQLTAQQAAGQQVQQIGAFSGGMPPTTPAWQLPQTYGALTASFPNIWGQYQPAA